MRYLFFLLAGKCILKKILMENDVPSNATVVLLDDIDRTFSENVVAVSSIYLQRRRVMEKIDQVDAVIISNGSKYVSQDKHIHSINIEQKKWMKLLTYSTVRGMIIAALRFPEGRHGDRYIKENYVTVEDYIKFAIFNIR